MKKVLAGIAILAIAAASQAGLLNSWTISSGTVTPKPGDADNADKIHFGTLEATDNIGYGSGNGTVFRANNWADGEGNVQADAYVKAAFTLDDNYKFTLEKIEAPLTRGNLGAANFIWKNENGTAITSSAGFTASGKQTLTFNATDAAVWTSGGELRLMAADGLNHTSGNAQWSSRTDIASGVSVYGTVSAVPEPATMSLLGLGALAIALRRKLRK